MKLTKSVSGLSTLFCGRPGVRFKQLFKYSHVCFQIRIFGFKNIYNVQNVNIHIIHILIFGIFSLISVIVPLNSTQIFVLFIR